MVASRDIVDQLNKLCESQVLQPGAEVENLRREIQLGIESLLRRCFEVQRSYLSLPDIPEGHLPQTFLVDPANARGTASLFVDEVSFASYNSIIRMPYGAQFSENNWCFSGVYAKPAIIIGSYRVDVSVLQEEASHFLYWYFGRGASLIKQIKAGEEHLRNAQFGEPTDSVEETIDPNDIDTIFKVAEIRDGGLVVGKRERNFPSEDYTDSAEKCCDRICDEAIAFCMRVVHQPTLKARDDLTSYNIAREGVEWVDSNLKLLVSLLLDNGWVDFSKRIASLAPHTSHTSPSGEDETLLAVMERHSTGIAHVIGYTLGERIAHRLISDPDSHTLREIIRVEIFSTNSPYQKMEALRKLA